MRNWIIRLVFLGIFVSLLSGGVAIGEDDFHSEVIKLYSFSPSKLSKENMRVRYKELDSFWEKVASDRQRLLPNLRKELSLVNNPPFFYYDGAKLLLTLSNDKNDKQLAVVSIARTDLSDIDSADYLRTIMRLGSEGIDTTSAAFRVLDYPKFNVFIPEHALTLEQDYSLIFMLYQLNEDMILEKTITRLRQEKDITARKSLLLVLWYVATPAADEAIARALNDSAASDELVQFVAELNEKTNRIVVLSSADIEKLRKQIEFNKALRKVMPIFASKQKSQSMSEDEKELFKRFLDTIVDSKEENSKNILNDIAENRDGTVPKDVSSYAKRLLKREEKQSVSRNHNKPEVEIAELKKMRQTVLSGLNDEVLYDFDAVAALIRWNLAKESTTAPIIPTAAITETNVKKEKAHSKVYKVSEKDELEIIIPPYWTDSVVVQGPYSTEIRLKKPGTYEFTFTIQANGNMDKVFDYPEFTAIYLKELKKLQKGGEAEAEVEIKAINGTESKGFYYSLGLPPRREPSHCYLIRGASKVGRLLLTFNILTEDQKADYFQLGLDVIRSARYRTGQFLGGSP